MILSQRQLEEIAASTTKDLAASSPTGSALMSSMHIVG